MEKLKEIYRIQGSEKNSPFLNTQCPLRRVLISDDGKISLSIKKAQEPAPQTERKTNVQKRKYPQKSEPVQSQPAPVWMPKKSESTSFEDMMAKFKQTSDEKFSDLKKKNPDTRRPKRSAMK